MSDQPKRPGSSFKLGQTFLNEGPPLQGSGGRVMKAEPKATNHIDKFEMPALNKHSGRTYPDIRAKFGALAITDPKPVTQTPRDKRFQLNQHVRAPLAIDAEEKRVIEERVQERMRAVRKEAEEKGFRTGYEKGLEKGYQESFQRFQKEADDRRDAFMSLVTEAEAMRSLIFRANERLILEVVHRVARMVMLKELATDDKYLGRLIEHLLNEIQARDNIRIRLHPDDFTTLSMLQQNLEASLGELKNLKVEPSNQVTRGGVKIETEWESIEADLDTQLERVREALIGETGAASGEIGGAGGGAA